MEPHNSIFAKIRGARFAPPMGAMPHPTLGVSENKAELNIGDSVSQK